MSCSLVVLEFTHVVDKGHDCYVNVASPYTIVLQCIKELHEVFLKQNQW